MKVHRCSRSGFTLLEIMIVLAIIGTLAAIALPGVFRARATSQTNVCISNLKAIDSAIDSWAVEHSRASGTHLSAADLQPYMGHGVQGSLPCCPTDPEQTCVSSYTAGKSGEFIVGTAPTCLIEPENHIRP